MSNTATALPQPSLIDYQAILESMSGSFIVLQPNAPHYTILAITDDLLSATGRKQEDTIGKGIFEVYPENPEAITATGPSNLRISLQNALQLKKKDQMPLVRYDVPDAHGVFVPRYWSASSKPVLDKEGNVLYIIHTTHEITEQVRAEQEQKDLSKIERAYNLFMQAPVAISIVTGPENIVELANEEILKFLGRTKDIIGKPLFESLPEAIEQGFPEILDQVRKTGQPFSATEHATTLIINGKEELRYYNFIYQPYYENPGDKVVAGVFSVAHDVTDLVLARKKVEESEQQVRDIIASSHHPIGVYLGKEMQIQFANQGLMDGLGKGNNIIGKRYKDLLPELENQEIFDKLDQVFATGIAYHAQNQKVDLVVEGKLKPFYFNFSLSPLINSAGQVYGIVNTGADITDLNEARKKIEDREEELKRFKFMADQAQDPFILMREDGTFAYLNRKALEAWGYSEEEARHIRVPDVDPVYQEELFAGIFARAQRETIPQFETLHRRKDGYIYPVEVNMNSINLEGQPHLLAVARDITERKQAEKALELKNAQLIHANKDLDNFIYTASHDLRSPITNIEMLMQVLKEELAESNSLSAGTEEILQRVINSINRFKLTIEDLTKVSRLQQAFSQNPVDEIINVVEVYQDIMADLDYPSEAGACFIETDFQVQQLGFSRKNFRSILYNLISNAIKYRSFERACIINVHTRLEEPYVVISVKDNGLGMSARQQEQLYTLFKRFHDHVEGTGIGLYMVKRIVENAGGKIAVESQKGAGTEFKVYLKASM